MKKVIVTGAAGFLGSALTARLLAEGVQVVAVDQRFPEEAPGKTEGLLRVEMRLDTAERLAEMIPQGSYDAFYHLAWRGVNGPEKADPDIQTENIRLTLACARAARLLGCGRFLGAGTVAERALESLPTMRETPGGMMYAAAKAAAGDMLETWCKYIGQPFVWMRFGNIYGPGNHTGNLVSYALDQLSRGEEAQFGPADQPYDLIYEADLLSAVIRLGDAPLSATRYYIGSGAPRILRDYLMEIGEVCGKRELIGIGKRPDDHVTYRMEMFDIAPLAEAIGPYVETSFSDGIRRTMAERNGEGGK